MRGFVSSAVLFMGCRYSPEELSQVTRLDGKAVRTLTYPEHRFNDCDLNLDGLTSLTPEQARLIVDWDPGKPLLSWTSSQAERWRDWPEFVQGLLFVGWIPEQSSCVHTLSLNGLTELDWQTASVLGEGEWYRLSLNGLTEIHGKATYKLVRKSTFELELNGVTTLSENTALVLGKFYSEELRLPNVREGLTVKTYENLSAGRFETLALGVDSLTVEQARELSKSNTQYITFLNLESASWEVVEALVGKDWGGYSFKQPNVLGLYTATMFEHWINQPGPKKSVYTVQTPDSLVYQNYPCGLLRGISFDC